MTTTAGETNRRTGALPCAARRGLAPGLWLVALLVVAGVSLSPPTGWSDLDQGPHMAAVQQVRHHGGQGDHLARERLAGTVPAPFTVVVAALVVLVAVHPRRHAALHNHHGPPPRGPPSLRLA